MIYLSNTYLFGMLGWLVAGAVGLLTLVKLARTARSRPRRQLALRIGLSLWMFLASLTALEIYFALFYDATDSFSRTNVSHKWFQRHVQPDLKSLRLGNGQSIMYRDDQRIPETLAANQHHVCFVGDSFTLGHGVADVSNRFSNRVRSWLDESQPGRFVVSNISHPGWDVQNIDGVLRELFANGIRPQTVVYVLCLNDIEMFDESTGRFYNQKLPKLDPQFFLFRDTFFFNWLYFRTIQFRAAEIRDYYAFVREYYAGEPWQAMQAKLTDMHRLCRTHGVDLRIVVFPFLHNLGPAYPFRDAHAAIVNFCERSQIPVLDLEPSLTPHVAECLVVNRFDAHPNALAHQLAAQAIRDRLLSELK